MPSATSAVRWHSNPEDGLPHPWLRNAMSIISAARWVIRTRVGLPIFVVWLARCLAAWKKGSRCMTFAIPDGLERTHGPCLRLLLLPDQYHWCNSKIQTHCSISKFTICDEASTSQCGVTCAKASKLTTVWIMIQLLQQPVLPVNHTCWLKGTWMISSAIWTCQRSKLNS